MIALRKLKTEDGFTMVELAIVVMLLSLLLATFYAFLFGGQKASDHGRRWLEANQTARLALERMTRELREADLILSVSDPDGATQIRFQADFDANGFFQTGTYLANITDDEKITYNYDAASQQLQLWTDANPTATALAENVVDFRFKYYGSEPRLNIAMGDPPVFKFPPQTDPDPGGIITWVEIDRSPAYGIQGFGNNDGKLNATELQHITTIVIEMTVGLSDQRHRYRTGVELRNAFK